MDDLTGHRVAQKTLLSWLQKECCHECEVWTETAADGSWSLLFRCGCEFCEHHVRKVVSLFYPDIQTTIVQ